MSILDPISKDILVEAMRRRLCGILKESATLTSKQATDKSKFINENASYEQLLNITLNPLRESKYLPAYVLEGAVAIIHRACLSKRTVIGENALTEGALKLQKETGAVITESMLDAAKVAVHDGIGLHIVGDVLKESYALMEARIDNDVRTAIDILSHNPNAREFADAQALLRRKGFGGISGELSSMASNGASRQNMLKRVVGHMRQSELDALERKMTTTGYTVTDADKALKRKLAKKVAFNNRAFKKTVSAPLKKLPTPPLTTPSDAAYRAMQGATKSGIGLGTKVALGAGALGLGILGWNAYKNNRANMED